MGAGDKGPWNREERLMPIGYADRESPLRRAIIVVWDLCDDPFFVGPLLNLAPLLGRGPKRGPAQLLVGADASRSCLSGNDMLS